MNAITIALLIGFAAVSAALTAFYFSQKQRMLADFVKKPTENSEPLPPLTGSYMLIAETTKQAREEINKLKMNLAKLEAVNQRQSTVDRPRSTELEHGTEVEMLTEMGQKITSNLKREDIFKNIHLCLNNLMDAAVVELGYYDSKLGRYEFISNIATTLDHYQNPLAQWCMDNKREAIINDMEAEHKRFIYEVMHTRDGREPQSAMGFPLLVEGRCIGVVCAFSFRKNAFTEYHAHIVRHLLSYTAVALDNAGIYEELKNTQTQLISQEKLASLGQLTAGIAHEIQNPLNFVNNFSKLSSGLVAELREELEKLVGKELKSEDFKYIEEIMVDLNSNVEKINHHGKRADSIVKGMLSHSRSDTGEKTPTDLNRLAEEYMNLSYHGLRGKDSSFNCEMQKELTEGLPHPNLIEQDMGRVLLNLFTNAFYAVNDRAKKMPAAFHPLVKVQSMIENNMVTIKVSDNGGGIPRGIIDKIFNPFFTTKPTGQGTGLGLSLSHDIVRSQGGSLELETKEGEGSTFIIKLPVI